MRQLSWDEYFDNYDDWSLATRKTYFYSLTDFGPADEVCEVVSDLYFSDAKFASRFALKAFESGVRFTPELILELASVVDEVTLSQIAEQPTKPYTRDELEELSSLIDDAVFERICKRQKMNPWPDEPALDDDFDPVVMQPKQKGPGFFTTLFATIFGLNLLIGNKEKKHNGKCNGNCADCPPHYGYRFGRWYYGCNHEHGCEFGGNKGS